MEKYRKFDDARNGVNPFVPAKGGKSSPVAAIAKSVSHDRLKSHLHDKIIVFLVLGMLLYFAYPKVTTSISFAIGTFGQPFAQVSTRRASLSAPGREIQ